MTGTVTLFNSSPMPLGGNSKTSTVPFGVAGIAPRASVA